MTGFLVSEHYKYESVTAADIRLAAIVLGYALGFCTLTCVKAGIATKRAFGRSRRANIYVVMIWGEIVVSLLFGLLAWLNLNRVVGPRRVIVSLPICRTPKSNTQHSFWLYISMCTCWSLQVQFLLQIIINRVSLILYNQRQADKIKWSVACLITVVNISVYCLWVPARLQINDRFVYLNGIWDRVEKVIYAVCDGGLNFWFLYQVRKTFLLNGMVKYKPLFRFNSYAVVISLSMDIMLIGTMSLNNTFIYALFHPVAYIVKLNIELTMADLIAKVARSTHHPVIAVDNEFSSEKAVEIRRPEMIWTGKNRKDSIEVLQLEHACYNSK